MSDFSRYYDAIGYIEGLSNIAGKDYMRDRKNPSYYLKRMRWFLDLLGNPDKGFKYVHITGTAGKGTVATMVHNALVASGYRTGLFTSPYVTVATEKIQVNGLYIDSDEFADIVDEIKPAIDKAVAESPFGGPAYFEIFLAIAFLYFKKQHCEWVVLEVGCGGRYDMTNVIEAPILSAITNIDYDHTHILGKTLTKIARDKSGIIKKGSKFFTTEARPRLREIMKKACDEAGAEFTYVRGGNKELVGAMGLEANEVRLPARFEIMQQNPIVIIDGAHNRAKILHTVDQLKKLTYNKLHLVVALAENKDPRILDVIPADFVYPTKFQANDRPCANPAELFPGKKIFTDARQALEAALASAESDDAILVTGSFYLAGELRKRWEPDERVLKARLSTVFPFLLQR